jgi:FkbM family methyltransferase
MRDFIIKADNHTEDIALLMDKTAELERKGIIHIGGHLGEEFDSYIQYGFKKIIFIEANPELCNQMKKKFDGMSNVSIYNYAIADYCGLISFHIHQSNSGVESSSIFKMELLDKIVTSIKTNITIEVECITLKEFFKKENINLNEYNFLLTDIQGADFIALKGADEILNNFDAIITEIQCIELYENFIPEEIINEFMTSNNFEKKFTILHELYDKSGYFPAWGESLYIRRK